jgi:uncharacterized membrane protein
MNDLAPDGLPKITRSDFIKLKEDIDTQTERLGIVQNQTNSILASLDRAQALSDSLSQKQTELQDKQENFYGKLIEIFGLFIAIFSFIIAGIQISTKLEGGFWEILGKSVAVFIPITVCICLLLWMIRLTSR